MLLNVRVPCLYEVDSCRDISLILVRSEGKLPNTASVFFQARFVSRLKDLRREFGNNRSFRGGAMAGG